MDWEDKFSAIVRETESNLARVKQRLGSAKNSASSALNFSGTYTGSYRDKLPSTYASPIKPFAASTPATVPYTEAPGLSGSNSSLFEPPLDSTRLGDIQPQPLADSTAVLTLLQEKLDSQEKTIENLSRSVSRLEREKDFYYKQVKDLRDELTIMNSRIQEKGVDMNTERKVEAWKRDMMSEVCLLQTQLSMYRSNAEDSSHGNSQVAALIREVQDLKRYVEDDLSSMRRELDTTKSRVARIEMESTAAMTEQKELNRRHDKLDRSLQDLRDSHHLTNRDLSRTLGETDHNKLEVTEMKNSFRGLREKINQLENQIYCDTKLLGREVKPKRSSPKHKPRETPSTVGTTDLNLSDSTGGYSSDLDLTPNSPFTDPLDTPVMNGSDADLDLDDLNLSDDVISSAGTMTAEDL